MKFFTPAILIVLSVGLFFGFTDGAYQKLKLLQDKNKEYSDAQNDAVTLSAQRDNLMLQYKAIPPQSVDKLAKSLPDAVDNVGLILAINNIAKKYSVNIKGARINQDTNTKGAIIGPDSKPYGTISISFSITLPYETFLSFLHDMESNLRFVDLKALSFTAEKDNVYTYNLTVQTYWLK